MKLPFAILTAMEPKTSPLLSSFVIRFVVDETQSEEKTQPAYRGAIRHIQTDEELNFYTWKDAVEFIQRYVPLEIQSD